MRLKPFKILTPVFLVLLICSSSYAKLVGKGEATGVVARSWYSGDRVLFTLNISNQKNDEGPVLASPNLFVYDGQDKSEVTEGDTLKLRYNSDDEEGIIVEKLEFTDNKPGTVKPLQNLPVIIPIIGLLIGAILIFSVLFYQIRKKRRQNV